MQALQAVVRDARDAGRDPTRATPDLELLVALAFALRDRMRRSGPTRHEHASGGSTLELKSISHRGFAFEVKGRTYIWEDVAPHVRRLKLASPPFLQLLEHPGDLHWIQALRAQDALKELWSLMQPVDEPRLEPRGLPELPPPRVVKPKCRSVKSDWQPVAVIEQGSLPPYEFVLASQRALDRLRAERTHLQPMRLRWARGRCTIEVKKALVKN